MTAPVELDLVVLETSFHVTSDDPRMAELVRDLWSPFLAAGGAPSTAVEVLVQARDGGWRLKVAGEPGATARDPWIFAAVLRSSLGRRAIGEATSIVPLHAAAVERDGTYVVLSGPPKTGKTTLLLELLDRGWRLVTDDLVPVAADVLTAAPFLKPLSVREPERWARFSGRWAVPEWLPPPAKVGLIPATAFPVAGAETYSPALLLFNRFDPGAEPRSERLSPARSVAACADNLHPTGPGGRAALPVLARLGAATPAYVLRYGSTEAALELLANCLADLPSME